MNGLVETGCVLAQRLVSHLRVLVFCLALLAGRLFFSLQGLGLSVDIEGPLSSLFPCLSYEEREIYEGEREKGGKKARAFIRRRRDGDTFFCRGERGKKSAKKRNLASALLSPATPTPPPQNCAPPPPTPSWMLSRVVDTYQKGIGEMKRFLLRRRGPPSRSPWVVAAAASSLPFLFLLPLCRPLLFFLSSRCGHLSRRPTSKAGTPRGDDTASAAPPPSHTSRSLHDHTLKKRKTQKKGGPPTTSSALSSPAIATTGTSSSCTRSATAMRAPSPSPCG